MIKKFSQVNYQIFYFYLNLVVFLITKVFKFFYILPYEHILNVVTKKVKINDQFLSLSSIYLSKQSKFYCCCVLLGRQFLKSFFNRKKKIAKSAKYMHHLNLSKRCKQLFYIRVSQTLFSNRFLQRVKKGNPPRLICFSSAFPKYLV